MKPHAKHKGRQEKPRSDDEWGDELTKKITIVKGEDTRARSEITTKEIVQVIADTLERLTIRVDPDFDRLNAEDRALMVARMLLHGASELAVKPVRIREYDYGEPPLCREHR